MPSFNPNRETWKLKAACYRSYNHGFFGSATERRMSINEYCNRCVVVSECGAAQSVSNGAWGGKLGRAV